LRYKTGAAFRQALETRLREQVLKTSAPLTRLRKTVAFERFLARLVRDGPGLWIFKGGFALQLRLGEVARTTKDIDAATLRTMTEGELLRRLRHAASLNLRDWFEFEIAQPTAAATGAAEGGLRFPVRCLLDGRTFENFHLDLGQGDPVLDKPDELTGPAFLGFAGIRPARIPCCPLTTQVAEKVHAYTKPYSGGESSRVRDLVDILLIGSISTPSSRKLAAALQATFKARATHAVPEEIRQPPRSWSGPYKKMARDLDLSWATVDDAGKAALAFVNPVLKGGVGGKWRPETWRWEKVR
jgi:hypothetical protein